jgi:methionyl-tRNA synthetase
MVPVCNQISDIEKEFILKIENYILDYHDHMNKTKLKQALHVICSIGHEANHYINLYEPWKLIKTDKETTSTVLHVLCHIVCLIGDLLKPFVPDSGKKYLINLML